MRYLLAILIALGVLAGITSMMFVRIPDGANLYSFIACDASANSASNQRLCYWMLSAFLVLEQIEDRIDELGRTSDRILRFRQRYSRNVWAAILKRCEAVVCGETVYGHFSPKTSEPYGACEYIVNHFGKLTRFLDDPRLPYYPVKVDQIHLGE